MNGSINGLQVDFFFQVTVREESISYIESEREVKDFFVIYLWTCDTKPVVKGFL